MEEKKLLRILIVLTLKASWILIVLSLNLSVIVPIVFAHENYQLKQEDLDFANQLRAKSMNITMDNIISNYKELRQLEGKSEQGQEMEEIYKGNKARIDLKVFVSSSMPLAGLKEYNRQAIKYGGTLVFKGLPKGSFKELIRLVTEINASGDEGSIQLDDEAFNQFGIIRVPTIIIARDTNCLSSQPCLFSYDKVEGNVGIDVALKVFAREGDLATQAKELLAR